MRNEVVYKTCKTCRRTLPETEFSRVGKKLKQYRRSECKECCNRKRRKVQPVNEPPQVAYIAVESQDALMTTLVIDHERGTVKVLQTIQIVPLAEINNLDAVAALYRKLGHLVIEHGDRKQEAS